MCPYKEVVSGYLSAKCRGSPLEGLYYIVASMCLAVAVQLIQY